MTLRTQRILQQIIVFTVVLVIILAHNSLVSLNARLMIVLVLALAAVAISLKRLRDSALLFSPLDWGWLAFVGLTGLTVLTAPFPRRSVELWLWQTALQLPLAYATLYLFRRRWPERALYRALLGTGALLWAQALTLTISYFTEAAALRAEGLTPGGFRLFGILNHPNILAMVIAASVPCMVGYLFLKMSRLERIACVLWLAGAALGLYGSGSRNGLVTTFAGVGLALLLGLLAHPAQPLKRMLEWARSHRTLAGLGAAVCIVGAVGVFGIALLIQSGRPAQDDGGGRLSFYRNALNMFVAQPIFGAGPGGFVMHELAVFSVPPYHPLAHAHNMFLTTAAENGSVGLIGLLLLLGTGIVVCWRAWRQNPERRPVIAGALAGLFALTLSGILDSPINQPGPFFLGTALLGFVAAGLPSPQPSPRSTLRAGVIAVSVWAVVLLGVVALIPYSTQWRITGPGGPALANEAAAQQLEGVLAYDPSDGLARLQTAYKWGWAASERPADRATLNRAIQSFEQAINTDPLSVHTLNLAALYTQAGRNEEALKVARRAVERASSDPLSWLALGLAQEQANDPAASKSYQQALTLEPYWTLAPFWSSSPLRQTALREAMASVPQQWAYLQAINTCRPGAAESCAAAEKSAPDEASRYYAQGLTAWAKGDLVAAKRLMRQVTVIGGGNVMIDAWFRMGDLAAEQNNADEALKDYFVGYQYLAQRGLHGFGTQGDYGYAILAFARYGVITDYLPFVVRLDANATRIEGLKVVSQWFEQTQNLAGQMTLYRLILQANPQDAAAQAALDRLSTQK